MSSATSSSPMSSSPGTALWRRALGHILLLTLLAVLATAQALTSARPGVALRAYSADVLWNDSWTSGAFVRSGATLFTHDPEFFLCQPGGCAPADLSDHAGQAVGIVCRRDPEGYVKLYYATDQEPAWASVDDVHLKGKAPACGWWDW